MHKQPAVCTILFHLLQQYNCDEFLTSDRIIENCQTLEKKLEQTLGKK